MLFLVEVVEFHGTFGKCCVGGRERIRRWRDPGVGLIRCDRRFRGGFLFHFPGLVTTTAALAFETGRRVEPGEGFAETFASRRGGLVFGISSHSNLLEWRVLHVEELTGLVELPSRFAHVPVFSELGESPGAGGFGFTFDLGEQAFAVDDPICRKRRPGDFGKGGEQVRSVGKVFVEFARRADALPTDDEGNESTALFHATFLSDQATTADGGKIGGSLGGAVVAHEEDDGILAQLEAIQLGDEFADELVHVGMLSL